MENTEKTYAKLKKLGAKNGDIEFQAEIPAELVEQYVLRSLAEVAEDFALPGFRKGKVPHETVRAQVGEMPLLEEAANDALRDAMADIVEDEQLDVIGRPQVSITKIAPGNPLEFKIKFSLVPEVSLPDYKKIAKQIVERKETIEISEKEIDEAIERIQKMVADMTKTEGAPAPLTDETVKQFGNFATVADFRTELKRQLEQEKTMQMKDARREEMIREIVKHSKVKLPQLFTDERMEDVAAERADHLKRAGLALEDYLKQTGKTAEQLDKETRTMVEDDLSMNFVVQAMRRKENINADDRDVHVMIAKLKLRYPDVSESELHRTAESMILQDKLFAVLEGEPNPNS